MNLKERIEYFYTGKGLINKSALELGLEQINILDDTISSYEANGGCEPELYKFRIHALEGLTRAMDSQYREFYDETSGDLREQVKTYHHDIVIQLTQEIIQRKKQRRELL